MLNSIGNTALVRCREVVRFSEGLLSEVRLYMYHFGLIEERWRHGGGGGGTGWGGQDGGGGCPAP